MPGLYRSKSVKRANENDFFGDFLKRDNKEILAAGCIQLFISTPNLDKWFKSSTGTLCFLKDVTRKGFFYLRVYSLMQGQLWEQKVQSPFTYSRLSIVFHYLSIDRFNFGFKFICEDEADRFYNVISKFSNHLNDPECLTVNYDRNQKRTSQLNEILNMATIDATPPISDRSYSKKSNTSALHTTASVSSLKSLNTSTIKPTPQIPVSVNDTPQEKQKHRRTHSIGKKCKIGKSDISCPFRCSTEDLHLAGTNSDNLTNPNQSIMLNSSTPNIQSSTLLPQSVTVTSTVQQENSNTRLVASKSSILPEQIPSNYCTNTPEQKPKLNLDENIDIELAKELLSQCNLPLHKKSIEMMVKYIKTYDYDIYRESLVAKEERVDAYTQESNDIPPNQTASLSQKFNTPNKKSRISSSIVTAPTPPPSPLPKNFLHRKNEIIPKYSKSSTITATTTTKTSTHLTNINDTIAPIRTDLVVNNFTAASRQQFKQQHFTNINRISTPSPPRGRVSYRPTISENNNDAAPPKPYRRSSLKIII